MARDRGLGVWSYPHFVRYLRAMIYKLTPTPHRCTRTVLDAANEILAGRAEPRRLVHLVTTPPDRPGRGRAAREAANAICEVIGAWAGFHEICVIKDEEDRYQLAVSDAQHAERAALAVGITSDDLYECAVLANAAVDDDIDPNRRDAAIAAMAAGHFKLAHEILTDTPCAEN